ncbi:hypothetical protein AOLI_G00193980 [Acnodon oligacanthus]
MKVFMKMNMLLISLPSSTIWRNSSYCVSKELAVKILKFADDTTVVGFHSQQ